MTARYLDYGSTCESHRLLGDLREIGSCEPIEVSKAANDGTLYVTTSDPPCSSCPTLPIPSSLTRSSITPPTLLLQATSETPSKPQNA
ncbi:hypothetical protein E2C01_012669 [Portunus trituberculatus]|uniref:Uncharacterized protein n=1 Tax=Portunus trituberculatus TaxID=210409 RepID=A0A5B7DER9_PORTR|nr:hypothetical protein [Portunus trituberculatus]